MLTVRAYVVVHRLIGMRDSYVAQGSITGKVRRDKEQFKIDHVVDDNLVQIISSRLTPTTSKSIPGS